MDRVIPKDVVDLIYKELHIEKLKRLNAEYHALFYLTCFNDLQYYDKKSNIWSHLNERKLNCTCTSIYNFKRRGFNVDNLPKRYVYSSGHLELKWIE